MPLVYLAIPLLALAMPILLYGMQKSTAVWLRPFLTALALGLHIIPHWGPALADRVLGIENNVKHFIGKQILHAEQPAVKWLNALRTFVTQLFFSATNTAIQAGRAVEQLAHLLERQVAVPAKVTWKKTTRTVYKIDKKTVAAIAAAVAGLKALHHTATVTVPRGIEGEIGNLREWVNRQDAKLRKQIRSAKRFVPVALTVAGLFALLRKASLSWIRCAKVKRVGKQVCGMDDSLLESLLADALLVVGTISVVQFAKELQAIEGTVLTGLEKFVREI